MPGTKITRGAAVISVGTTAVLREVPTAEYGWLLNRGPYRVYLEWDSETVEANENEKDGKTILDPGDRVRVPMNRNWFAAKCAVGTALLQYSQSELDSPLLVYAPRDRIVQPSDNVVVSANGDIGQAKVLDFQSGAYKNGLLRVRWGAKNGTTLTFYLNLMGRARDPSYWYRIAQYYVTTADELQEIAYPLGETGITDRLKLNVSGLAGATSLALAEAWVESSRVW
ncbi:MAG: hypothetical protein N3A38_16260 [Planctomycetota bacterium]|nr:hypothetical protein [Planctomycetota bacterium]